MVAPPKRRRLDDGSSRHVYIVMAHKSYGLYSMADIGMAYIGMAPILMAYKVMADIVMTSIVAGMIKRLVIPACLVAAPKRWPLDDRPSRLRLRNIRWNTRWNIR